MNDHVLIALQHESGSVSRMQFGVKRKRAHLDDGVALKCGFTLDEDGGNWLREPSEKLISQEIDRTAFQSPVVKWWRIKDGDPIPARARANVVALAPSPSPDDDPLPRFLTPQSDTIAPEMLSRVKDHEERAKAVVDEAARNFQVLFSSNDERFTALEKNLDALRSDLLELGKRIAGGTE